MNRKLFIYIIGTENVIDITTIMDTKSFMAMSMMNGGGNNSDIFHTIVKTIMIASLSQIERVVEKVEDKKRDHSGLGIEMLEKLSLETEYTHLKPQKWNKTLLLQTGEVKPNEYQGYPCTKLYSNDNLLA